MGKIVKKVKKIIPKEIKPVLPYIAAYYGGPLLAKQFTMNPAFAKFLTASAASKLQGDDTKTALRSGIFSAAPDVISSGLGKFEKAYGFQPSDAKALFSQTGEAGSLLTKATPMQELASIAGKGKQAIEGAGVLKTIGAQTAVDVGARTADLNEKALRDYEAQLREQGIMDSAERRNKIFGYFSGAGYEDDEINAMLTKYGYATGGRVGYDQGGRIGIETLYRGPMTAATRRVVDRIEGAVPNEDDENYEDDDGFKIYPPGTTSTYDLNLDAFGIPKKETGKLGKKEITELARAIRKKDDDEIDIKDFMSGLDSATKGIQMAFGRPIDMMPERTRFGLAEGGIMNVSDLNNERFLEQRAEQYMEEGFSPEEAMDKALDDLKNNRFPALKDGGMLNTGGKEMDMRGGGFIPIGSRERADDVPARLSKNEFVMTADAVRAAGGGSINRGAKRMYDLMNRLEAKA